MNEAKLQWYYDNETKFSDTGKKLIYQSLQQCDDVTFMQVADKKLKDPGVALLLSFFWLDRFYLKKVLLGLLKFMTCGGLFVWGIVDIVTAAKRARLYNAKKVLEIINPQFVPYVNAADLQGIANAATTAVDVTSKAVDFLGRPTDEADVYYIRK